MNINLIVNTRNHIFNLYFLYLVFLKPFQSFDLRHFSCRWKNQFVKMDCVFYYQIYKNFSQQIALKHDHRKLFRRWINTKLFRGNLCRGILKYQIFTKYYGCARRIVKCRWFKVATGNTRRQSFVFADDHFLTNEF